MTDLMQIKSDRLKAIRLGRKIGRPKLAKLTGLTERRLAKIETEATFALPRSTVAKLSGALQVPELTLTGELPVTEEDLNPVQNTQCTSGCCG
ncbi:helix-turn-helix transcriptional regulator [Alphaproteobacteria bacterium KMM 3653]|uniref:Helix-turn-helix transcriptional regulator n=1 Tax=Harenicola maris TaxID=2841044 RepID=A0AAP2G2Y6_9RHOB|nr:helix-turn-helix transcriptional regulator [Harenicola maris]